MTAIDWYIHTNRCKVLEVKNNEAVDDVLE